MYTYNIEDLSVLQQTQLLSSSLTNSENDQLIDRASTVFLDDKQPPAKFASSMFSFNLSQSDGSATSSEGEEKMGGTAGISTIRKGNDHVMDHLTSMTGKSNPEQKFQDFIGTERKMELEEAIREPYNYIAAQKGKEIRTALLNAFNVWLNVDQESLIVIIEAVRMLHTASLLIDDIQDNSHLRRGKPTAHKVFGVAQTINAGNYVYFLALQKIQELKNKNVATQVFLEEVINLHKGQGMDLFWRETLSCPTENEYLEMVSNKTGGLFRLGVRLMQAESRETIDVLPLVHLLGLIFQIADDYHNLANHSYSAKKGVYEDLTEGKFSFPVIHSIHKEPRNKQLLNILAQKTDDLEVKRLAVSYIKGTGSLEYTKGVIARLVNEAESITDGLSAGSNRQMRLLLARFILE